MSASAERLELTLTLMLARKQHRIPSGNVKCFDLTLSSHGVEGCLDFLLADDKRHGGQEEDTLFADFVKPELIELQLELRPAPAVAPDGGTIKPLSISGLVREKTLSEVTFPGTRGSAVLHRRYGVHFVDPARLLWTQHHPCELHTDETFQKLLDAHKGDRIKLRHEWEAGREKLPMLFLGLDPTASPASFYDFVLWYLQARGGIWSYDHPKREYLVTARRPAAVSVQLPRDEVRDVEVHFPEVPRHKLSVLNTSSEHPGTREVPQEQAVAGIRHDLLVRTAIDDELEARKEQEKQRLVLPGPEWVMELRRFPSVPLVPNTLVELPRKLGWSTEDLLATSGKLRVHQLRLTGDALDPQPGLSHNAPNAAYRFQMTARLEREAEPRVRFPGFVPPRYPLYVEGTIISEPGEKQEGTHQVFTDKKTSAETYKVSVPLWKKEIAAPFEPNLLTGHLYLPAYKSSRVLLALELEGASIIRFLDWRPGARLPQEAQGGRLLLGKAPENSTTLTHAYESNKPVFTLIRTHDKDMEMIQMTEGSLLLQVKERSGA